MTFKHHLFVAFIVLAAAVWEFAPLLDAGFVFQDSAWQFVRGLPGEGHGFSRSLMRESWQWQERHTPSPLAFHAANLALHICVSFLVAFLAYQLGASAFGTWIAGSVFLLNPIQAESVAYLSGRTELFAAIGVLCACLLLLPSLTWWRIVLAAVAMGFAMLGKESAIILVALVPIVRQRWALATTAMASIIALLCVSGYGSFSAGWVLIQAAAAWRLLMTAVTLTGHVVDYDYLAVSAFARWASVILLSVGLLYGWARRDVAPRIAIGACWVAAVIGLRLFIRARFGEMPNVFNEHQFYLAMVGCSLIVSDLRWS